MTLDKLKYLKTVCSKIYTKCCTNNLCTVVSSFYAFLKQDVE